MCSRLQRPEARRAPHMRMKKADKNCSGARGSLDLFSSFLGLHVPVNQNLRSLSRSPPRYRELGFKLIILSQSKSKSKSKSKSESKVQMDLEWLYSAVVPPTTHHHHTNFSLHPDLQLSSNFHSRLTWPRLDDIRTNQEPSPPQIQLHTWRTG